MLGNTLIVAPLGKNNLRNLDAKGLDNLLISLQVANTLAPFISKSYCFFCWSTLTLPDSMKFNSWFWNWRDILSISSMQIILGISCSRTSNIRLVVLLPSKYITFLNSKIPNGKSVFALAGLPMKSKL
jgi:hypothetical protein